MAKLNIDIPDDLKDQLREYAQARGISEAAAVRVLLHDALAAQNGSKN
jgi:hypothetical protein